MECERRLQVCGHFIPPFFLSNNIYHAFRWDSQLLNTSVTWLIHFDVWCNGQLLVLHVFQIFKNLKTTQEYNFIMLVNYIVYESFKKKKVWLRIEERYR